MKNKHQPPCSSCFILQVSGSSCFILQVSGSSCFILQVSGSSCFILQVSGSSCFILQVSGSSCFILQVSGSVVFSSLSSLTNTIFTAADLSSDDTPPDIPACFKSHDYEEYFSTYRNNISNRLESRQNNKERGESERLPPRLHGVWQTNVCVLAPPAGLECEAARGGK